MLFTLVAVLLAGYATAYNGYTYSKGACRGGHSPGANAGLRFYSGCNCYNTCNAQASCTGFVVPWSGCGWCETYTSRGARGDGRNFKCWMKNAGGPAVSGYTWSKGACRGGNSPGNNAGLRFYGNRNCQNTCNAQATCTGFVLPTNNSNWCETYTSPNAKGDGRNYHCYMKNNFNPKKCTGACHYDYSKGACRGGNSPGNNAGLRFFSNRNCEATCNAQATCTGFVLPWNNSNWCETYTSVNARGDNRNYKCYMKSGRVKQHCAVSAWTAWGNCNKSCGRGAQSRTRRVTRNAANGGNGCPGLSESRVCNAHACPIHCQVNGFGGWGACNKACGGGLQYRTRTIRVNAQHGGNACPALREQKSCNTGVCIAGYTYSYGACRGGVSPGANAGLKFFSNRSCQTTCNNQKTCTGFVLPVNNSNWCETYTSRNAKGDGRNYHCWMKNNFNPKSCKNALCAYAYTKGACRNGWSPGNNAGLKLFRDRNCATRCNNDLLCTGYVLPWDNANWCETYTSPEARGDNRNYKCYMKTGALKVNCAVSAFGAWGGCNKTCGNDGVQVRRRSITRNAANGGAGCPGLQETRACNRKSCPVDCLVSAFGAYGACSQACGPGTQTSTRRVTRAAAHGGRACPALTQTRNCNNMACQCISNCQYQHSKGACRGGAKPANNAGLVLFRDRNCESRCNGQKTCTGFVLPVNNAAWCETYTSVGAKGDNRNFHCYMKTGRSKVNCVTEAFSAWGACSKTCGTGAQTRSRKIRTAAANGGTPCGPLTETKSCNTNPCPVDCVVSAFTAWGACNESCGGGKQYRTRTVTKAMANNGKACPALSEEKDCNTQACPINCKMSNWGPWSKCSKTCDSGVSKRTRTVETEAQHGGAACPASKEETQPCNTNPCPVDCVVSAFGAWKTCDADCGPGKQTRTRTVTTTPKNGGKACPGLEEEQDCKIKECPIDCKQSAFGAWGVCNKPCGAGVQTRTRSVLTAPQHGGKACGAAEETQNCEVKKCPIDCEVSDWGPLSQCTVTCGQGQQTKTRTVTKEAQFGGEACGELSDTTTCDAGACPVKVDCKVSAYGAWGQCTKACGGGKETRTRTVTTQPANGGDECPALTETRDCNQQACGALKCEEINDKAQCQLNADCEYKPQTYVRSEGACRGGETPANNAGLVLFRDRACEDRCNKDADCTGYVLPKSNSNWCETYTSKGAVGDNRNFWCFMKEASKGCVSKPCGDHCDTIKTMKELAAYCSTVEEFNNKKACKKGCGGLKFKNKKCSKYKIQKGVSCKKVKNQGVCERIEQCNWSGKCTGAGIPKGQKPARRARGRGRGRRRRRG